MNSLQPTTTRSDHPLTRQVNHWTEAGRRLRKLDDLAAQSAWLGLETYLGTQIRESLMGSLDRLDRKGDRLRSHLARSQDDSLLDELEDYRKAYLRAETTLNFFTNAINSRTNTNLAALLSACDWIARKCMEGVLQPLGFSVPPVLCYPADGEGAAVLKAGLRLWDRDTINPVAAIKIARHNLLRPTALLHEAGHQVSYILHWNEELSEALASALAPFGEGIAGIWSQWSSEISADTYAFVHAGYASVSSLHDVLSGQIERVFRFSPGDPHPINYLRVLLSVEMCRQVYGAGHWDQVEAYWKKLYPIERAPDSLQAFLRQSVARLPLIARVCLQHPFRAFGGRSISFWIDPARVSWASLRQLENTVGPSLLTSPYWLRREGIRLLALYGYRFALQPHRAVEILDRQRSWLIRLGQQLQVNQILNHQTVNHAR